MSSDCKGVLVSLNSMPDPNLSGSGCALIFAIATRNLLGSGAVCTITSTVVTVTLGTSATLVPGNTIALLANGLIQAGTGTPFNENVTVTIDWPDSPPLPVAVLSGPTLVGARCAAVNAATAVVLDASLSSDPSGRPLGKYYWTLASAPDDVSLASARAEVAAQQGASQLWLDSRDLGPGNYTVALTVASFLGQVRTEPLLCVDASPTQFDCLVFTWSIPKPPLTASLLMRPSRKQRESPRCHGLNCRERTEAE